MKFNVTIQTALPIQSGTSKNGKTWQKQTFVGVYDSSNPQYPKLIVFDVLGDNINKLSLQPGGQYEVEIDFSAREYQGKWYMSASCWKATPLQQQPYSQSYPPQGHQQPYVSTGYPPQQQFGQPQAPQSQFPTAQPLPEGVAQETDDLPF